MTYDLGTPKRLPRWFHLGTLKYNNSTRYGFSEIPNFKIKISLSSLRGRPLDGYNLISKARLPVMFRFIYSLKISFSLIKWQINMEILPLREPARAPFFRFRSTTDSDESLL